MQSIGVLFFISLISAFYIIDLVTELTFLVIIIFFKYI